MIWGTIKYVLFQKGIKNRILIIYLILNMLLSALAAVIIVIIPKYVVDGLTDGVNTSQLYLKLVILTFCLLVCIQLSTYCRKIFEVKTLETRYKILKVIGERVLTTDYENVEDEEYLSKIAKAKNSSNNNRNGVAGLIISLSNLLITLVTLVSYAIILANLSLLIPVILVIILLVVTIIKISLANHVTEVHFKIVELQREHEYYVDTIYDYKLAKEFRLYTFDKLLQNKIEQLNQQILNWKKVANIKIFQSDLIVYVMLFIFAVGVIIYGVFSLYNHTITLGDLTLFVSTIPLTSLLVFDFANLALQLKQRAIEIEALQAVVNSEEQVGANNKCTIDSVSSIEFCDVSFKYPNSDNYVLRNINLKITGNEKVAIVGENGAGKTTFVKLLLRLHKPTCGKILVNGIEIENLDIDAYYSQIAAVFQDFHLYPFTLAKNIAMSNQVSEELVFETLEQTVLKDKLARQNISISDNVSKYIVHNSTEFSGGETQRISIARALYKKGTLFVLDEPNSALDPKVEETVIFNIFTAARDSMLVMVSHRALTTKMCDRIIVFENTNVVEDGSHDELLKNKGIYAKLYNNTKKMYKVGDYYE